MLSSTNPLICKSEVFQDSFSIHAHFTDPVAVSCTITYNPMALASQRMGHMSMSCAFTSHTVLHYIVCGDNTWKTHQEFLKSGQISSAVTRS
ncbi:hypothetical protein GDO81_002084 [Engystomops pustulosus]|uniref:Uncharacterized protein n=1 Tax=Engystomops pustulosus TaxID=76066 RepID=A0AAV7DK20_ENGPU|nr:hypothetical protein GDO81_002084 [Engystomops pustulosus]